MENNDENKNNPSSPERKKDKKASKYPKEEFPSVFAEDQNQIIQHLPAIKVKKVKKNVRVLNTVSGPYEVQHPHEIFLPYVSARSISTYPHIPGRPKRDGDPVCDSYCVQLIEDNIVIAVVADGCNWGKRPMEASNKAKSAFVEFVRSHITEISNVMDIGHFLLSSISYCHYKIIEGKDDIWEAGTTTLIGGLLIPLKKSKEEQKSEQKSESNNNNGSMNKWVFCYVSIGDCKVFHFQTKSKKICDITKGNRKNVHDARDPGGRLGPYVGDGQPDLRNITINCAVCEEEDIILMVSDGVHDNLDPQTLGKYPKDVDKSYAHVDEWKGVISDEEVEKLKDQYTTKLLVDDLICGGEDEKKLRMKVFSFGTSGQDDDPLMPEKITNKIMHHCLAVTGRGREWMEQNPKEKLPNDYVNYPGKMDHATVICLRVGQFEKELLKASKQSNRN